MGITEKMVKQDYSVEIVSWSKNKTSKIIAFQSILILSCLNAAIAQYEDKLGSWFIYNGFYNISPKVQLFF